MGNVAEPATKHFLTRDIYTHITYAELEKQVNEGDSLYQPTKSRMMSIGDTLVTSNSFVILRGLDKNPDKAKYQLTDSDLAVSAVLEAEDINRKKYTANPLFVIHNFTVYTLDADIPDLGLKFTFEKIDPATGKIQVDYAEKKSNKRDFVIMKAIIFPGINILWIGCILMIIGSVLSIRKRILQLKERD